MLSLRRGNACARTSSGENGEREFCAVSCECGAIFYMRCGRLKITVSVGGEVAGAGRAVRGEWTLTSEGVAAVQSIRSCGSVPRSVDDPRERESAPCGAAAAPEEFEPGELACRTPEGDAEPPRSIRRGTSMDRPSRVSTRLAPSDSLVAAASPSIPPRRGPHRLQCVTRPAKRRSVTLRAGSHDFISSAPGSACHSPNLGTSEPPAADVRRTGARDTAPLPQTYRACARASVRRAPPSPPAIFVA